MINKRNGRPPSARALGALGIAALITASAGFALAGVEGDVMYDLPYVLLPNTQNSPAANSSATAPSSAFTPTLAAMAALPSDGRSLLYPTDWRPLDINNGTQIGTADGPQFLHDFSYAGYGRGEIDAQIPPWTGNITVFVAAPTGNSTTDTLAIQSKIDQACGAGGGVVNIPAGTYTVRPQGTNNYAITIPCSRVILRGAGAGTSAGEAGKTYIYNDNPDMRAKSVILIQPNDTVAVQGDQAWYDNVVGNSVPFAQSTTLPTRVITLATDPSANFAVGDKVVLRTDITQAFRDEHGIPSTQWLTDRVRGLLYFRGIKAINSAAKTITLDIPVRYPMKTRDNARVFKTAPNVIVVGVENLTLGMKQNDLAGTGDSQFSEVGTGAYQMNNATLVTVARAEGIWIRNVRSYRPSANVTKDVHMLSRGVYLTRSTRNVTIDNVYMARPQYRGEGGNGYMFTIAGGDNLLRNAGAFLGRHNFLVTEMSASGNVFLQCRSTAGRFASDTHRGLSHANLYDSCILNNDHFQTTNRQDSSNGGGITGTQNVYWNTQGDSDPTNNTDGNQIIATAQFGWGYVIGTKGPYATVFAATNNQNISFWNTGSYVNPVDYTEGLSEGALLVPQSLFNDQVTKRRSRGSCTTCP